MFTVIYKEEALHVVPFKVYEHVIVLEKSQIVVSVVNQYWDNILMGLGLILEDIKIIKTNNKSTTATENNLKEFWDKAM